MPVSSRVWSTGWGFSLLALGLGLIPLWAHESDAGQILGRYSSRYALALGVSLVLAVAWLIGFFRREWLMHGLLRLPESVRLAGIGLAGIVLMGLAFLPIESPIKDFLLINGLAAGLLVGLTMDALTPPFAWGAHSLSHGERGVDALTPPPLSHGERGAEQSRPGELTRPAEVASRTQIGWIVGLIFTLVIMAAMLLTALNEQRFSPDEAHWADYASSAWVAGGVYARTWLQEPTPILPGLGWSVAAYGWALENISFNIRVGRLWTFAFNLLTVAGVYAVTWRLYGRRAALISAGFAALCSVFIPLFDYRPHYQLAAACAFITFATLQGRLGERHRWVWHGLCGLLATLALQLHAAGLIFALAFSVYYAGAFVLTCWRERRLTNWQPVIAFGLGALTGTALFWFANIVSVGGLSAYLTGEVGTRWSWLRSHLLIVRWPSLPEGLLILAGLLFIIRRRSAADQRLLALLVCVLLATALIDTQGYWSPFAPLYVVPVGALVVGLAGADAAGRRVMVMGVVIIIGLGIGQAGRFINWRQVIDTVRNRGFAPTTYEQLRPLLEPYIQPDDVVVSSHQLIWTYPELANLVSYGAELTAMRRWGLSDPAAVWERVQPTVLVYIDKEMVLNPGLETYLERHAFQPCAEFPVAETRVIIYRETCS